MENNSPSLDHIFHALADPTRRAVIAMLTTGPVAVKELAAPFDMGLPSFLKHVKVLQDCGLILSEKVGRVRTCSVVSESLRPPAQWLSDQRAEWQGRTDRLADFAEAMQQQIEGRE